MYWLTIYMFGVKLVNLFTDIIKTQKCFQTTQNSFLYNHYTFFIYQIIDYARKWKKLSKDILTNLMGKLIHKMIIFTWQFYLNGLIWVEETGVFLGLCFKLWEHLR